LATIEVTEWHPDIGSVWARVVSLWTAYVVDITLSWTSATEIVNTHHSVIVTVVGATDTNIYHVVDGAAPSIDAQQILFVQSRSGWLFFPGVLEPTYGGRTTSTDWVTNIQALREDMWSAWCSAALTSVSTLSYNLNGFGGVALIKYFVVQYDSTFFIDWTVVTVKAQTSSEFYFQSRPVSTGQLAPSQVVVGGSSAAADLTPVVAALNDIALIDVDYQANNGGDIFSLRGRVRS
jgi:hypothetical protein